MSDAFINARTKSINYIRSVDVYRIFAIHYTPVEVD